MADPHVPQHWFVAPWRPDPAPLGQPGAPVGTAYNNLADAKTAARNLAALSPGLVYVVYMAQWYAYTDTTPVKLLPVVVTQVG
jgi:hypothetical protein